jgi:hypothetical protein
MKLYTRYSYWLRGGNHVINNRHQPHNPQNEGDVFLGEYYAHQNTPYIRENGDVVRDRYGSQVVLFAR